MSRIDPKFGLVLFDREISTDQLASKGSGTRDSAYTEAGPVPGQPTTEGAAWRPYMTRAQSLGLSLATIRTGYPGRDGASVVARLGSESASTDYRSWQEPNLVADWTAPADGWGSSQVWTTYAATVITETQTIVIVAVDASGNGQTWSYDTRTRTWSTLYDWDAGTLDGLVLPIGLTYDEPTGRLLLWSGAGTASGVDQVAYYSEDGGTTWSQYSREFLSAALSGYDTAGIYKIVRREDSDWLMIAIDAANSTAASAGQYASSDRGGTWELVGGALSAMCTPVDGPAGLCLVYIDGADSYKLKAGHASSARAGFVETVTISSTIAYGAVWAVTDYDGTIYAYARGQSGTSHNDEMQCWRSFDGGVTWAKYGWGTWAMTSTTQYVEPYVFVAAAGAIWAVSTTIGNTSTDGTVQLLRFGGWSQVAEGHGRANQGAINRCAAGAVPSAASAGWTAFYVPISAPGNVGWTAGGGTGAATLAAAEPGLKLTTTAGQAQDYFYAIATSSPYAAVEAAVKLDASGNVTLATLGSAGNGVHLSAYLSDLASYYYEARIDVGTDGLQLRETKTPAILATTSLPLDTTADYVHIRLHLTKGKATAWYSVDGGQTWKRWANQVVIPNWAAAAAGSDGLSFGNKSGQVGVSYWRLVTGIGSGDWQYGTDGMTALGDTAATRPLGHAYGRPIPGKGWSYPAPFATDSSEDVGHLVASGGPTQRTEVVDIPAGHEYPIEALDPLLYPSPRRTWRSTSDASDVKLVYDHGEFQETWHGGGLALLVIGGTPRLWVLEQDDGSTGWTTLATLDLALGTGLKWIRTGRTVTVDTGSDAVGRYIQEHELVGGYFDLDGIARRIVANSAGFWTDATIQLVRLTLEGIDDSEADDGTAGVLVAPSGLLIYYPGAFVARRYVRVRVAGGAVTPDGDYRAGIVAVGRVVGIGTTPGWGWSVTHQQVVAESTGSDGVVTRRQLGPPKRSIQYTFSEPSQLQFLHGDGTAGVDYVAASGGAAIGTGQDAPLILPALLDVLQSGETPCVVVPRLPNAGGTLLNPASWVYGRVRSDLTVTSQQSGTEFVDEALTVSSLTVEEIR